MLDPIQNPNIVVIGSINMDLVVSAHQFPCVGETLFGQNFQTFLGGKGANQAVAAARLGAQVTLVGAVGDDDFGLSAKKGLLAHGVNLDYLKTLPVNTGVALITVAHGENHIVVVSGANHALNVADVEAATDAIARADVVLCQLEIPMACVQTAARIAKQHQKPFILNPAPAQALPVDLLEQISLLTPNEVELGQLFGVNKAIHQIPYPIVLTAGSEGAYFVDDLGKQKHQTAFEVEAVDSTGAGDTFNAALAVFWFLGIEKATRYACAAAALSTTKMGAQTAMPVLTELKQFLNQAVK